jgi:phospholipid/cholesterol/gamma-HCH transport system substrate-binding protein
MEDKAHALIAGLFLLLLGLALAAAAVWFQSDRTEHAIYTVVARSGVPGLNVKAPVKLRGVEVGRVEAIAFDPADPQQILVTLAVAKAAPVTTQTYAQLGLQGVTGLSFISLEEPPASSAPRAAGGARIVLKPTLLDRLAVSGPELLVGLAETAQRLNAVLSEGNRTQLTRSITELGNVAQATSRLMTTLQPSVQLLPGLLRDADTAVQNASGSLQHIDTLVGDTRALAQDLHARAAALDQLGAAARQIESSTRRLEAAIGGGTTRARPLLDDLGAMSLSIERSANALAEQPQSLLFGRSPVRPGPGEPGFEDRLKVAR